MDLNIKGSAALGPIDILVNSAGGSRTEPPRHNTSSIPEKRP